MYAVCVKPAVHLMLILICVLPYCVGRLNSKMRAQGRNLLLIIDNASSHAVDEAEEIEINGLRALRLSNVTILFLPANVTSHVQPLDQGIIAAWKARYKKKLMSWLLDQYNNAVLNGAIDVRTVVPSQRQAVEWMHQAYQEMPASIISNCWRHSGTSACCMIAMTVTPMLLSC